MATAKKSAAKKAPAKAPARASGGSKATRFVSRFSELKLVREPAYTEVVNGRTVPHAGTSVQFSNGVFETSDADELAFLRDHANFGDVFIEVEDKQSAAVARAEHVQTLEERNAELEAEVARLRKESGKLPREQRRDEVKTHAGKGGAETTAENVIVEEVKSQQADPSVNEDAPAFDDEDEDTEDLG